MNRLVFLFGGLLFSTAFSQTVFGGDSFYSGLEPFIAGQDSAEATFLDRSASDTEFYQIFQSFQENDSQVKKDYVAEDLKFFKKLREEYQVTPPDACRKNPQLQLSFQSGLKQGLSGEAYLFGDFDSSKVSKACTAYEKKNEEYNCCVAGFMDSVLAQVNAARSDLDKDGKADGALCLFDAEIGRAYKQASCSFTCDQSCDEAPDLLGLSLHEQGVCNISGSEDFVVTRKDQFYAIQGRPHNLACFSAGAYAGGMEFCGWNRSSGEKDLEKYPYIYYRLTGKSPISTGSGSSGSSGGSAVRRAE